MSGFFTGGSRLAIVGLLPCWNQDPQEVLLTTFSDYDGHGKMAAKINYSGEDKMKRLFFSIALALVSNGTLLAASFDGNWKGIFECAASPTDPAKVPAYSTSFALTVSGATASGSRVAPNISEVLIGTVEPQGSLRLSGTGQKKSGEGQPWTTMIGGSFSGDRFVGNGGIYANDGRQARQCNVRLTRAGEHQAIAATVEIGGVQSIPKHLQLARELVATVKPENNHYNFQGTAVGGIRWKGELFASENAVNTHCTGFVTALLIKAGSTTVRDNMPRGQRQSHLALNQYVEFVNSGGIEQVKVIQNVQPGDLYFFQCPSGSACTTTLQGDKASGHAMIVDTAPEQLATQRPPIIAGTTQWRIAIIDSADQPNSRNDTRWTAPGEPKVSGVGRTFYRIYTDANGVATGYTHDYGLKYTSDRSIYFARPNKSRPAVLPD